MWQKFAPIPFSRTTMKERLRWLDHVLGTKDGGLREISLFGQSSRFVVEQNGQIFEMKDMMETEFSRGKA